MPIAIKIPPALRKVFDSDAESAFVDVLNQFGDSQVNGFERTLEVHTQSVKDYADRRLAELEARIEKRFAELEMRIEKRFAEFETRIEKRFAEFETRIEKRFAEVDVKMEKRFAEADTKMEKRLAENHKSLLRWMFVFYMGTMITLIGFLFTFMKFALN